MMFRMTGDEKYLEHAENIADMLLSRLPVDGIPYWDFDAPNGNEYRDASAGAIMASAFVADAWSQVPDFADVCGQPLARRAMVLICR